jgi:hypothetical protein
MIERRTTRSGPRFEVRLQGPDGREWSRSFHSRRDAERYERDQRAAFDRGNWIDPRRSSVTFAEFAQQWLGGRPELQPRTVELYGSLLRRHLLPDFRQIP